MWAFLRPFFSTPQPSIADALAKHNERLTDQLFEALKASQAHNHQQSETLDRIVAYRFDAPARQEPFIQPRNPYAFNDVEEPSLDDIAAVEGVGIDDDMAFLVATQGTK